MHWMLRPLLAGLLALVIGFTGFQTAAARGQSAPAGIAEICIGTTVVTVHVDRDGNPVSQRHLCPDGAFALFAAAAGGDVAILTQPLWLRWDAAPVRASMTGRTLPRAQARGPPVAV